MSDFTDWLGLMMPARVRRLGPHGAFLVVTEEADDADARTVLLPRSEVPDGMRIDDAVDVFVYLDSEDRPVATLKTPKLTRDEIAFLPVTDIARFGAFFGWGLLKDLFVPFAEQTRKLAVGEEHPIALYVDDSGRLAGTMRVSERLRDPPSYDPDQWVEGEAWRKEPGLGVFFILERRFVGLLPESEPNTATRGARVRLRVANVLADGKVELSLRRHAHEELEGDAERILAALREPGAERLGDHASPEDIRACFGLSKKAYKRALGRLLKQGAIALDAQGLPEIRKGRADG